MPKKKKITILTRHYPPNKNINGILACEMTHYLESEHNCSVSIICMDTTADGNKKTAEPVGNVLKLNPYFKKKENKFSKLFAIINEGYRLIKKAKKIDSDLIICTTSPPLLPFWASLMFKKKHNWALWSLDLFPEVFLANNQLKKNSILYKFLFKKTYKNPPNHLIALGEQQANNIISKYKQDIPTLILPAGVVLNNKNEEKVSPPSWYNPNQISLGYFGNISAAHNPTFIENCIQEAQNNGCKFILAAYGIHSKQVKEYAKQFSCVHIIEGGIPQGDLQFINIHLVSLLSAFTHVAVPSKAVTAISCGRPILFCGNKESDNWQMFQDAGWLIDENKDISIQITNTLKNLTPTEIKEKASRTKKIYTEIKNQVPFAYKKIPTLCQ